MIPPSRNAATRFLIIRRDNIGDLVCTTPAIRALRTHFPRARIALLVNSYNAEVIARNGDVDEIYVYTKLKHRSPGQSLIRSLWARATMLFRMRRAGFDYAIIAGSAAGMIKRTARLAKFIGARHIIAFADPLGHSPAGVDLPVVRSGKNLHEVEETFRLFASLGVDQALPAACVFPDPVQIDVLRRRIREQGWNGRPVIGVHISARKPSNRWPVPHFVELLRALHARYQCAFILFWSPGPANDPRHPGDDAKAEEILVHLKDLPMLPWPTHTLSELISGVACCNAMICSDGGAMHIAAGLDKPILCFFGDSDATHWRPWGVPYVLLQPPSRRANDVSATEALTGFEKLMKTTRLLDPAPVGSAERSSVP